MGYEHYWHRLAELPADPFSAWSAAVARVIAMTDLPLAGPDGTGDPIVTPTLVAFNGRATSFLRADDYIAYYRSRGRTPDHATYLARLAPLGGAQDACSIAQEVDRATGSPDDSDWVWDACKTQLKPYDEVVTAALALLSHHFPRQCAVSSDGKAKHWSRGIALAEHALGLRLRVPSYRHGWRHRPRADSEAFRGWRADVAKVIATCDVPLAGPNGKGEPIITAEEVAFNGVGDDAGSTFRICMTEAPGFAPCRTSQRPYDVVVTAAVILLAFHYGNEDRRAIKDSERAVISDGDAADWISGLELAQRATGRQLSIPPLH